MSFSEYLDDDDDFLAALGTVNLPGDAAAATDNNEDPLSAVIKTEAPQESGVAGKKRERPLSMTAEEVPDAKYPRLMEEDRSVDVDLSGEQPKTSGEFEVYGPSKFGEFGDYFRRRRAKLQIQNSQLVGEGEKTGGIFSGLAIYINGRTEPSVQDLRKLIIQHGGEYHAFLDRHSMITHIITCALTPAKMKEFKQMKVVTPQWLVQSAKEGKLLPWRNFIFRVAPETFDGAPASTSAQGSIQATLESSKADAVERNTPPDSRSYAGKNRTNTQNSHNPPNPPGKPPSKPRVNPFHSAFTGPKQLPVEPLYTTDAATKEAADRIPSYAAHKSNPHAERAMKSSEWRAAHTSVSDNFIDGFYKNSRLHHLSTWKAELQNIVAQAHERLDSGENTDGGDSTSRTSGVEGVSMHGHELVVASRPEKGKEVQQDRYFMHCDFDSFFVAAGLVDRPELKGKAVVVCHSQGGQGGTSSTSEIASSSYEARKFGIKNGMSLGQARKLCPHIQTIPYEFERYKEYSLKFYSTLFEFADDLQAVSVDEALVEVTSEVAKRKKAARDLPDRGLGRDFAKEVAEAIRDRVRAVTNCEISIGVSSNIMLARLATRKAKPAGSFHLRAEDAESFLANVDITQLHGIGYSVATKAQDKFGTIKLGELGQQKMHDLCAHLGKKTGETIWNAARGIDSTKLESDKPRKSVSCEINFGIRFETQEQAEKFMYQLAAEVSTKLKKVSLLGRFLTLKIMKRHPSAPIEPPKFLGHGMCESFSKSIDIAGIDGRATSDEKIIGEHAWRLLKGFVFDPKELRGIGIQILKLEKPSDASVASMGQSVLGFVKGQTSPERSIKRGSSPKKPIIIDDDTDAGERAKQPSRASPIRPKKESLQKADIIMPTFSQIDPNVLNELPPNIRDEIARDYPKGSTRSPSPSKPKTSPFKKPLSPQKQATPGPSAKLAVRSRITAQLAPKGSSSIAAKKSTLFTKRVTKSGLHVTDAELQKLGIDPTVFAVLPESDQKEQLTIYRGASKLPQGTGVFKKREKVVPIGRPGSKKRVLPPPKAKFAETQALVQKGRKGAPEVRYDKVSDIQDVIKGWFEGFADECPRQKDIDHIANFMVECVTGGSGSHNGLGKATSTMKWWKILLERRWPQRKPGGRPHFVGEAWWDAFGIVKDRVNEVVNSRFGGKLSV
ncbi:DNA repair protein [Sistotremastrum niveocremeum HHB9708]|uniref:DNA repair protein REV1 n=1 Tax=Sistotremastrum niveocremeum HHB9708 TaxID=1314777 RepID=A0A165AE24_9AGAM|nr:DNA repair protein [Sistotremastrum niveocremeum HHB9708]